MTLIHNNTEPSKMATAIAAFRDSLGPIKAEELDVKLRKGGEEGLTDQVSKTPTHLHGHQSDSLI